MPLGRVTGLTTGSKPWDFNFLIKSSAYSRFLKKPVCCQTRPEDSPACTADEAEAAEFAEAVAAFEDEEGAETVSGGPAVSAGAACELNRATDDGLRFMRYQNETGEMPASPLRTAASGDTGQEERIASFAEGRKPDQYKIGRAHV